MLTILACNDVVEQIYVAWYIDNQTDETLYLLSLKSINNNTIAKRDTTKWRLNYWSENEAPKSLDFSLLYSLSYDRNTDIILVDSNYHELKRWSIYDSIIDNNHIMNEDAWQNCVIEGNNKLYYKEWLYVISEKDLEEMRKND